MADLTQEELRELKALITKGSIEAFTSAISKAYSKAETTKELEKLKKSISESIKANQGDAKIQKDLNEVNTKAIETQRQYLNQLEKATGEIKSFYRRLGATGFGLSALTHQTKEAGTATKEFIKAGYEGSGSIGDFTKSFEDFLGPVGSMFNFVGQRAQTNVEAFRLLSEVGANFSQNLIVLRESAAAAALPLSDFADLVGKNSQNLAALFGSTTLGAKQFSQLAEQFRTLNIARLAPLGFTVNELNETLLAQFTLLRRTNNFERMTNVQRLQSAQNLALELDRLAKLTGQQRSAMAAQLEAQLANERFTAFLTQQTPEVARKLSGFTAAIGGLAPGLQEGFQDLVANVGTPTTEAARQLVQNIPEASAIIRQLTTGAISSEEALVQLRNAAQRSNQSLAGVARTGTVEFARLFGEVNKLATAKLDLTAVTDEQRKKAEASTQALTQFEDASKRLSAGFQSIETGFFAAAGNLIGDAGTGINKAIVGLGKGIESMSDTSKAVLFLAGGLGDYFLDSGKRIAETSLGVAGGIRLAGRGLGGLMGTGGRTVGPQAGGLGRLGRAGAGLGLVGAGSMMTGSKDAGTAVTGAALGALGGGLTGAQLGAFFGPAGAVIGGLLGAVAGGVGSLMLGRSGKRASGGATVAGGSYLVGERGPELFTPSTSGMITTKSQLVSNDTDAINTAFEKFSADLGTKIDSMTSAVNKNTSLNEQAVKALNTQVALTAQGNKINDRTRKGVAEMGSLV